MNASTKLSQTELKVCIVGGGNAAHAMAALFPAQGISCNIFAPFGDEAYRIQKGIDEQSYIVADFASHNDPFGEVKGRPERISSIAAEVIPECNVLIMPLPSFAYRDVFSAIKPYLQKNTYIGVTPGQGGVDWMAKEVLGDILDDIVLFSIMPMPFNCRITDFGKSVYVQEFKRRYKIGVTPSSYSQEVVSITNQLFGFTESCGHIFNCSLYPMNAVIHPARLYTLCKNWQEGDFLDENPYFYEDMNDESADLIDTVNQELIAIADMFNRKNHEKISIPHIKDFLLHYVYRDNSLTLKDFFSTNHAYKGFRCPFIKENEGWIPDFSNRYFTEDIPFGLCLYKGVAEIVEADTPAIDRILTWAQNNMKKEYLIGTKLIGRDIFETACPQRFGIKTVEHLMV
jgi:hypothetical protein